MARVKKSNYFVLVIEDAGTIHDALQEVIELQEVQPEIISLIDASSPFIPDIYSKLAVFPNPERGRGRYRRLLGKEKTLGGKGDRQRLASLKG